tara:strand:+ start:5832 stop:6032 length:201 start_codon:yes stop_codon:yes gene_type:complete
MDRAEKIKQYIEQFEDEGNMDIIIKRRKFKQYIEQFEDEGNMDIIVNPDGSTIRIPATSQGDKEDE